MTLYEFFQNVYPLFIHHMIDKVEKELDNGDKVTAYWVGNVLRIDIKLVHGPSTHNVSVSGTTIL